MTDYKLKDDWLKIAFRDVNTPAEGAHLKVFKRDGSGDVLANAISDVNGDFPVSQWPDYSGDVIACYYYESPAPYVAPVFETDDAVNVSISGTVITNSSFSTGYFGTTDSIGTAFVDNIYAFQFDIAGTGDSPVISFGSTTATDGNDDSLAFQVTSTNTILIAVLQSDSGLANGALITSGTFVLDTLAKNIILFNQAGAQTAIRSYSDVGTGDFLTNDLYLRGDLNGYPTPVTCSFFTDKTTMPYDLTLSDLGVYLTANPNWKQVGEANTGSGTKHPPRVIVASPVEYIPTYVAPDWQVIQGDLDISECTFVAQVQGTFNTAESVDYIVDASDPTLIVIPTYKSSVSGDLLFNNLEGTEFALYLGSSGEIKIFTVNGGLDEAEELLPKDMILVIDFANARIDSYYLDGSQGTTLIAGSNFSTQNFNITPRLGSIAGSSMELLYQDDVKDLIDANPSSDLHTRLDANSWVTIGEL